MITVTISVLAGNHLMKTGKAASFVYLGRNQMKELESTVHQMMRNCGISNTSEAEVAKFDDMTILAVNTDDHVAVS